MLKWGSIYLGLKKKWITSEKIFEFCNNGLITCDDDRLAELYIANDNSYTELLELIKNYITLNEDPKIVWNEEIEEFDFSIIDSSYWEFWELHFLSQIINSKKTEEDKLHMVADLHSEFYYKESWHKFIYYMPSPDNIPIGNSGLYNNLLDYINVLINSDSPI